MRAVPADVVMSVGMCLRCGLAKRLHGGDLHQGKCPEGSGRYRHRPATDVERLMDMDPHHLAHLSGVVGNETPGAAYAKIARYCALVATGSIELPAIEP